MRSLTIATRNSPLAVRQTEFVAQQLKTQAPDCQITLLPLVTSGDKASKTNWNAHSGKGLFVKELEEALLDGRADLAVHSMKDLPTAFPETLGLGAVCSRENPFDALVSLNALTLDALPAGATIGTASIRRQSQLLAHRPDIIVKTLRGNVQTRLAKLQAQEYDAIVLACAGLKRLHLSHFITQELKPPILLPACGQGAIGIECRQSDSEVLALLANIHCADTALCVNTERALNEKLGGNCQTPIAIFCNISHPHTLTLQARVLNPSGTHSVEATASGAFEEALSLVEHCIRRLENQGVRTLLGTH